MPTIDFQREATNVQQRIRAEEKELSYLRVC